MYRALLALGISVVLPAQAFGQISVYDPAVTIRNSVTAAVKELVVATQTQQHSQLRRMAQRLSLHTLLTKYALPDAPRWRTHGTDFLFGQGFLDALTYGDPGGAAYLAVSHPVLRADDVLQRLSAAARRDINARLSTIEASDSVAMAAAHDSGRLRFNGRRELSAIEGLEAHVIDPSNEQSATAVLDKISGAALIAARQRQARVQLLAGVVEQLLIDTKRARDADVTAMNMQLVNWRDGRAVNAAFVAGSGEALRTWRQP